MADNERLAQPKPDLPKNGETKETEEKLKETSESVTEDKVGTTEDKVGTTSPEETVEVQEGHSDSSEGDSKDADDKSKEVKDKPKKGKAISVESVTVREEARASDKLPDRVNDSGKRKKRSQLARDSKNTKELQEKAKAAKPKEGKEVIIRVSTLEMKENVKTHGPAIMLIAGSILAVLALVVLLYVNWLYSSGSVVDVGKGIKYRDKDQQFVRADGVELPTLDVDGVTYVPVSQYSEMLGFKADWSESEQAIVVRRQYGSNIPLYNLKSSAEKTQASWWLAGEGGEISWTRDGQKTTKKVDYGALIWKNWDGLNSDQEGYGIKFDVTGFNILRCEIYASGDMWLRFYVDGEPIWEQPLKSGETIAGLGIGLENANTLEIRGYSLDNKASWAAIMNPVLDSNFLWDQTLD